MMDLDDNSDTGEDEIAEPEYDHFDTTNTTFIKQLPEEIEHSNWSKLQRPSQEVGACFGKTKLLKLLRRKLLEHKWGDAALLMEGIASQPLSRRSQLCDVFRNVGNEVIFNHPASKYEADLVLRHKQAQKTNGSLTNPMHVLYEYVMYLLVKKDFQSAREALNFFQGSFKKYHCSRARVEEWMDYWSPVLEGYLGLLDYLSWKAMGSNMNAQNSFLLSETDQEQSVRVLTAEQAIQRFEYTLQLPGVWDIFIVKYIELLEDMDRIESANEVLQSYSDKNVQNPNAHKYWYDFLVRHSKTDLMIKALSRLRDVAPSDIYMIDLHCLKMKQALGLFKNSEEFLTAIAECCEIVMDMLDYETWMTHEKVWSTFATCLQKIHDLVDVNAYKKFLNMVWFEPKRNTWWPRYHFTKFKANEAVSLSNSLAKSKSLAAFLLIGNCDFCNIIEVT